MESIRPADPMVPADGLVTQPAGRRRNLARLFHLDGSPIARFAGTGVVAGTKGAA